MSEKFLGIDPALSSAWAVVEGPKVVAYGHWDNRGPAEGRAAEDRRFRESLRFGSFAKQMSSLVSMFPTIRTIAYEWVWKHSSTAQTQLYSGWRAVLLAECDRSDLRPIQVAWSTLKSVATGGTTPPEIAAIKGKGKKVTAARREAWKAYCIGRAQRKWGLTGLTDDEADAIWVAEAARLGRGT